jgi:hypothetical protein
MYARHILRRRKIGKTGERSHELSAASHEPVKNEWILAFFGDFLFLKPSPEAHSSQPAAYLCRKYQANAKRYPCF